jgi:hypothetical protein
VTEGRLTADAIGKCYAQTTWEGLNAGYVEVGESKLEELRVCLFEVVSKKKQKTLKDVTEEKPIPDEEDLRLSVNTYICAPLLSKCDCCKMVYP